MYAVCFGTCACAHAGHAPSCFGVLLLTDVTSSHILYCICTVYIYVCVGVKAFEITVFFPRHKSLPFEQGCVDFLYPLEKTIQHQLLLAAKINIYVTFFFL